MLVILKHSPNYSLSLQHLGHQDQAGFHKSPTHAGNTFQPIKKIKINMKGAIE